jgi:hypothetical protein
MGGNGWTTQLQCNGAMLQSGMHHATPRLFGSSILLSTVLAFAEAGEMHAPE